MGLLRNPFGVSVNSSFLYILLVFLNTLKLSITILFFNGICFLVFTLGKMYFGFLKI